MKTKDLLLQISRVETLLKQFSFEELSVNEAAQVQKSFALFKGQLVVQLRNKSSEAHKLSETLEVPELYLNSVTEHSDHTALRLTPEMYNEIIEHFDTFTVLMESLKIDFE